MNVKANKNSLSYRIVAVFMIVMLMLAAMPVTPAYAAVSTPTFTNFAGTTGPFTISNAQFACAAGANRLLVAVVTAEYNNNPEVMGLTVTKGVAFTQALKTTGNTRTGIWIGYLNDAQITANAASNLVITEQVGGDPWSSSNVHLTCLTGVNQTTPIVAGGTAFNSSDNNTASYTFTNIPAVNTGLMIYAAGINNSPGVTAPAGYTESVDLNGSSHHTAVGYKVVTATGNESGTVTFNSNDRYAGAVISVNPALVASVAPTITSLVPANGTQGVAYNHNYTATGTAPITFTLTAGAFPPGLTLTTAGVLSGTPTTPGTYTGTVTAANGVVPNATQNFSIVIAGIPPTITSLAPANGTQGVAYNHNYTATGTAPITFTLTAGAFPPGLTLTAAGVLSGTPTTPGTYTGTVTAANGRVPNATQNFSIVIAGIPPTITSLAPANGTQGIAYSHTYTATGTLPITFSFIGTLPPGLNLTAAGVLSGTPTIPGTYTGTVTASNGFTPNATQNFSIVIAGVPPTITSLAPAGGAEGVAYTHTYTATGTAPVTFTLTAGALPTGLNLTAAGVLSGTPTTPGTFTGTVTAANGFAPDAAQNFSIVIAAIPPTIISAAPVNGAQGVAYNHTYTATGTAPITFSITSGALPTGLTLSSAGVISGTPTALGTFTGVVTATNGTAPDATQNFSITISLAPTITSADNTDFTIGTAGAFTVTASGSPVPNLSMIGTLPTGVTFTASTGVLAGTPAAGTSGTYSLVFTADNGTLPNATQNFTLTVSEGPSITSANNTTFSVKLPGTFTVTAVGLPAPTLSMTGTLPSGVTFTPGTGILSGTPNVGSAGVYPLTFNAVNGILPNASQSFTLTVKNGPIIASNGINSVPDTGNGSITNNESIVDTLNITKLIVKFDHDVYNVASGDPDFGKSVVNPANYLLVKGSSTGLFDTIECAGGVGTDDTALTILSVTYTNGGGAGPFVATLTLDTPLNTVGYYHLHVCGTTSIVDASDTDLKLAGDGTLPGTDFLLGFRIQTPGNGNGNGNGNNDTVRFTPPSSTLIPVTGFAPNAVTKLPAQPADKAYKPLGEIRIEIPTLGVNYPIVGVMYDKNTWNLTWLKDSVAYLEGSAYPTLPGNTVLTAHVVDANNNLGPFSDIKGMKTGQKIYIHAYGQVYVYQVQENKRLLPVSLSTVFKHEEYSWVTLVTCEDFNAKTGEYTYRRMVRAVLISVVPEKK